MSPGGSSQTYQALSCMCALHMRKPAAILTLCPLLSSAFLDRTTLRRRCASKTEDVDINPIDRHMTYLVDSMPFLGPYPPRRFPHSHHAQHAILTFMLSRRNFTFM